MVKRVLEFDSRSSDAQVLVEISDVLMGMMPSWGPEKAWLWLFVNSLSSDHVIVDDVKEIGDEISANDLCGHWDAVFKILVKHIDAACDEIKALSLQPPAEQPKS